MDRRKFEELSDEEQWEVIKRAKETDEKWEQQCRYIWRPLIILILCVCYYFAFIWWADFFAELDPLNLGELYGTR
jgi:hypothetical protein